MTKWEGIPGSINEWFVRILRPLVAGVVLAVITSFLLLFVPNRYVSEARLLATVNSDIGGSSAALSAMSSLVGLNFSGGDQIDQNIIEIYRSRWLGEQLLDVEFEFDKAGLFFWRSTPSKQTLRDFIGKKKHDKALSALLGIMSIETNKKTGMMTLSVETTSPRLSFEINKKSIELLEEFLGSKNRTRGGQKALFTKQRLEEAKKELTLSEEALVRFANVNKNYASSSDARTRIAGAELEGELQLKRQIIATLALNYENALLEEKNVLTILNILDPPSLPDTKNRPPRMVLVFLAFVLGFGIKSLLENRKWIGSKRGIKV